MQVICPVGEEAISSRGLSEACDRAPHPMQHCGAASWVLQCRENEEMIRESSLTPRSLECQHFRACHLGSGCEQQRIPVRATGLVHPAVRAAVPGLTWIHVEKLFFSQESQTMLWWVFGGTEFGREKHLQLQLLSCLANSTRPSQLAALLAVLWNNLCWHLWKCYGCSCWCSFQMNIKTPKNRNAYHKIRNKFGRW